MVELRDDQPRRSTLERILYLHAGEFRQILPFFALYLLLFMGLTLADAVSLTLFVQQVGATRLPGCYALTALLNLLGVAAYLGSIRRFDSVRIFQGILAGSGLLALGVWILNRLLSLGTGWYALLFVGREMAYTLILMHFGTYLLDHFGRDQLRRVLPVIYAGGRVGGIAGGLALQILTTSIEPIELVLLYAGLFALGILWLNLLSPSKRPGHDLPSEATSGATVEAVPADDPLERDAATSLAGFLTFVWQAPLMYWTTVTSILFVVCRWILNYQYSSQFEQEFANPAAMARFLGQYTQIALLFSLILQLTLVNRLVCWIGLKGAHFVYGALVVLAFSGNLVWWTLPAAVFSRFVETELRFGLRNPIAQMMLNQFSVRLRVPARAWSLGFLIPCATLMTALLLSRIPAAFGPPAVAWLGLLTGAGYLATSFGLYASFSEAGSRTLSPQDRRTSTG